MDYQIVDLIRKKRDNNTLSSNEIRYLVHQYAKGCLPDYQMSAFLMAAFLNGLNDEESTSLTHAMLSSGSVLDLSHIPGVKVDKHSTGGVGDKLSLILAPIVASLGVRVPMVSGRGLGHTGGTLDKLESIPGFRVDISLKKYVELVEKHGLVLAGQTNEMAPADKKMYALRDVTATVESIPLIAGSIMSKKLAEGIDALVLDVKYGSGAFMKTHTRAIELAQTLVDIGESFKKPTIAFISSMETPTGLAIGNWLEVLESIDVLQGNGPSDTLHQSTLLSGAMLLLAGTVPTIEAGIIEAKKAISSGKAFQKFREIVQAQGGDLSYIDRPDSRGTAKHCYPILSSNQGYITRLDAYLLGTLSVRLGAGRQQKEHDVDPLAGIRLEKKLGDYVQKGETLMTLHTNKDLDLDELERWVFSSIQWGASQAEPQPLISHILDKNGLRAYS
jgi:pyrimidine-nucleoside phosphorylase